MSDSKTILPDTIAIQPNLILQAVRVRDAQPFLDLVLVNEEYFSKFDFMAPQFKNLSEIEDVIENLMGFQKNGDRVSYGLWENSELMGLFTINRIDWFNKTTDIGFWLGENSSGRGLGVVSLQALVDCCLQTLNLNLITAHTAITNTKSQNLLKKCGFKQSELLKGRLEVRAKLIDEFLFTLERST